MTDHDRMLVIQSFEASRHKFLDTVGSVLHVQTGGLFLDTFDRCPEELRPYLRAFDQAGHEVLALLFGIVPPTLTVEAMLATESGARRAAQESWERAYQGGLAAGLQAIQEAHPDDNVPQAEESGNRDIGRMQRS
jgi:hypothetical protein